MIAQFSEMNMQMCKIFSNERDKMFLNSGGLMPAVFLCGPNPACLHL